MKFHDESSALKRSRSVRVCPAFRMKFESSKRRDGKNIVSFLCCSRYYDSLKKRKRKKKMKKIVRRKSAEDKKRNEIQEKRWWRTNPREATCPREETMEMPRHCKAYNELPCFVFPSHPIFHSPFFSFCCTEITRNSLSSFNVVYNVGV